MNYTLYLAIPLMLIFAMCGMCSDSGTSDYQYTSDLPTCDDINCVSESLDSCSPTSYESTDNGITYYVEIRGRDDTSGECNVYFKLKDIDSSVVPSEYSAIVSFIKGSDANCLFSDEEMSKLKSMESSENVEDDELLNLLKSNCKGSLIDILSMAG